MEKALENNNTEIIDESNKNIKIIENELDIYRDREAKILANRAKTKWYSEGEKSNKYFLNIIKKRQQKKLIDKLEDEKGEYRTNIDDKLDLAKDYYEKLYKKQLTNIDPTTYLREISTPTLTQEMIKELNKDITTEELLKTVKQCKDSAPGQDGLTYSVYKHFWDDISPIILNAWKYSCEIESLSKDHLCSIIMMLEKKNKDRTKLQNLRPITLSNCDIKIITKTLANRLKNILPHLIHNSQTAYINGRQVHDNLNYIKHCMDTSLNEKKRTRSNIFRRKKSL